LASACTLLTEEDAGAALGEPTDPAKPESKNTGPPDCIWFARNISGLSLTFQPSVELQYWYASAYQSFKNNPESGQTVIPVSGVGDDAFNVVYKQHVDLYVAKAGVYLDIIVEPRTPDVGSEKAAELTLARKLVSEL
jgi:hypothetical protein